MADVEEDRISEQPNLVAEPQLSLFEIDVERPKSLEGVHTSKRGRRERRGVHRWHAYYAGYAEQFVMDVLDVLAEPGDLVLDPWNGSGTTTLVAQCRGYDALGIEANPVMALHAQAKHLHIPSDAEAMLCALADVLRKAREIVEDAPPQGSADLLEWVHDEPARALLATKEAIFEVTDLVAPPSRLSSAMKVAARTRRHPSMRQAFLLSALFQVLREVGRFRRGSNPTWLLVDESASSVARATVFGMFDRTVLRMLDDLERYSLRSEAPGQSCTITGDSRALELRDDSVDLVITSPPYCTRIDYVVSTKPELLLLGYQEDEIDGLRRENIGAPVIVDKEIAPRPVWGAICNEVVQGVNDHESKASRSYYLPLYLQYFRDAEQSLREIQRVLRPGGEAAIVVQSSYYKELEIPLGNIYVEMSRNLGLQADIGRREVVKQHMAHINTKSSEYVKNKVYYEDVVHVEKLAV